MATKQELEVRVVELEAQLAAAGSPTVDTSTLERDLEQASLSRDQWKAEAELQAKNVTDLRAKLAVRPAPAAAPARKNVFEGTVKECSERFKKSELLWDHRVEVFE